MADNQFRKLPYQGGDPRLVAEVVNRTIDGGLNSTGSVTLTTSSSTTVVADARVSGNSIILFMPLSSNSSAELSALYVSARSNGSFTITHNSSGTTRAFGYVIIG
tara:strand:- start:4533 stop:4847 length:315 start_codon:yes stop_codon:yes gene_type:complete